MDKSSIFGQNLIYYRKRAGWSLAELGRQLEGAGHTMHMTNLRRIESGERIPRIWEATALAEVLGVPVEAFTIDPSASESLAGVTDKLAELTDTTEKFIAAANEALNASEALSRAIIEAERAGVPSKLLLEAREQLRECGGIMADNRLAIQ